MKASLVNVGLAVLKLLSLVKRPKPVARHAPWEGSEEDFFDKMLNEGTYAVTDNTARAVVTTYHDKETHEQLGMAIRWPNRHLYFETIRKG
ncbi:hypothetical protein pEaSNUABM38_00090 [Erwinia phage pEa_SNUABM_38]|nr:hypothetical protein pEaSNUABM38_00090 [Erwinia phage pEa_SNUABM_38]